MRCIKFSWFPRHGKGVRAGAGVGASACIHTCNHRGGRRRYCPSHTRSETEGGGVGTGVGVEARDIRDGETEAEEAGREKTSSQKRAEIAVV